MWSWLPPTNGSVILAMIVASLLPLLFAFTAKILGGFTLSDNATPREFTSRLSGIAARAQAAQQNSYETLPIFLAAVVTALLFFVPLSVVSQLAWLYILLRLIFGLAYLANWATFRSVVWVLGLACPLMLFYLAMRLS